MLTIDSGRYFLPKYRDDFEDWVVWDHNGNMTSIITPFRYTVILNNGVEVKRLTFDIEGPSVKPNMRTLRKFGSDRTSWMIKKIRFATSPDLQEFIYDHINGQYTVVTYNDGSSTTD